MDPDVQGRYVPLLVPTLRDADWSVEQGHHQGVEVLDAVDVDNLEEFLEIVTDSDESGVGHCRPLS
jgi:hypothetical protein